MLFSDKHLHTPTRLESDLTIAISENQLLRVKQLLAGVVDNGKQILAQAIFQFIPPIDPQSLATLPGRNLHLIHIAAFFDSLECFIYLCHRGLDINTPTLESFLPLHFACAGGSLEVATYIIRNLTPELKQNLNFAPEQSWVTPLFLATHSKSIDILRLLFKNGAEILQNHSYHKTPLIESIENKDLDCFLEIFNHSKLEGQGDKDDSPLMKALSMNSLVAARFLVENGADVNYRTSENKNALFIACFTKNAEMVKFLLENGADVNKRGFLGKFPIHHAAMSDNVEIVKMVINAGADPKATDTNGIPPTFSALCSVNKRYEIISLLFEAGISPNAVDPRTNSTILNSLFLEPNPCEKDLLLIKLALEKGANLNQKSKTGFSLYQLAMDCSDIKIRNVIECFLKEHPEIKII